jgi:hypothetical protein
MLTIEFEKLAEEYDQKFNLYQSLLNHFQTIPSLWRKDKNNFIIITKSAKQPGQMQLTYFRNNEPTYDMIRDNFTDFAHELVINDCNLETINYIN